MTLRPSRAMVAESVTIGAWNSPDSQSRQGMRWRQSLGYRLTAYRRRAGAIRARIVLPAISARRCFRVTADSAAGRWRCERTPPSPGDIPSAAALGPMANR
jgi:hypothetical protein